MSARLAIELHLHAETHGEKGAFLLSRDGDVNEARWFPKSLCARVADGRYQVEGWKLRQEGFLDRVSASQGRLGL